ncbi:phage virion morphogenesis protein [Thermoflavifilum thermophilum]|uniref:Phage virion morphogenesis family protein n=1 Tax=Thermoflavifilum thermophilum TaxID=1393122 RepID=A0A1I7NC96_9BACT|nr:phage virion morphogenesis protein [Thermoflavifilum thermophilum]SFV32297.1 Phage virion morphogenesis family protein [Thermoflavifilum thermophilum]
MKTDAFINRVLGLIRQLPPIIGNEAVNFFKTNFRLQGWQGQTFEPWPKRKRETKRSLGKPILIQTGALERSIQVKQVSQNAVVVGTSSAIPYARIHNEGGTIVQAPRSETFIRNRYKRGVKKGKFQPGKIPGRGFTYGQRIIHIPRRQFMGDSPVLRAEIQKRIIQEVKQFIK